MRRLPCGEASLPTPDPIESNSSEVQDSCGLGVCEDNLKANRGFSLLELLIVVAIILIIATIAIPSLLRSRQAANETSAVANLRGLNTAQVSYGRRTPGSGAISNLVAAGLMDSRFNGAFPVRVHP
jgi:prepilin-type N-terminal cleavage/methylation domain-containing protein